jgi:hypothetical protein
MYYKEKNDVFFQESKWGGEWCFLPRVEMSESIEFGLFMTKL